MKNDKEYSSDDYVFVDANGDEYISTPHEDIIDLIISLHAIFIFLTFSQLLVFSVFFKGS